MKKLFVLIFLAISFIAVRNVYALTPRTSVSSSPTAITTPSSTPSPTGNAVIDAINSLKDRIASKVAQLNLVEKRGMLGIVTDVAATELTVIDREGNNQIVDVDELTQFSSPSAKSTFGISDITKGSTVGIVGRYNKDSKRILARYVDVMILPVSISGSVTAIDTTNFQISVTTPDLSSYTISIQDLTRTYVYTKADGLVKSGFSKIVIGERVFLVGFPTKNDPKTILASRIIRLIELKPNPLIPIKTQPTQDTGVTPSTGSGTKLVPILRR